MRSTKFEQANERLTKEVEDLRNELHATKKDAQKVRLKRAEAEKAYQELFERMRVASAPPLRPDPYRVRVQGKRLEFELYLAREALSPDTPVYVFQHTMKTGGTSIRSLVYNNLADKTDFELHDIPKEHPDFRALYADFYDRLGPEKQARIFWVVSHTASHIVPYVGRPVRGITIVRESLDRVLSRFWYPMRVPRTLDGLRTFYEQMSKQEMRRGSASATKGAYSNYQSRCLLEPYYDVARELPATCGRPPEADLWRERLFKLVDETYTLLPNDRLDDSFGRLAATWGWNLDQPHRHRVNQWRPTADELDPDLRRTILGYNWLDEELYRRALERNPLEDGAAPEWDGA